MTQFSSHNRYKTSCDECRVSSVEKPYTEAFEWIDTPRANLLDLGLRPASLLCWCTRCSKICHRNTYVAGLSGKMLLWGKTHARKQREKRASAKYRSLTYIHTNYHSSLGEIWFFYWNGKCAMINYKLRCIKESFLKFISQLYLLHNQSARITIFSLEDCNVR